MGAYGTTRSFKKLSESSRTVDPVFLYDHRRITTRNFGVTGAQSFCGMFYKRKRGRVHCVPVDWSVFVEMDGFALKRSAQWSKCQDSDKSLFFKKICASALLPKN